MPDKHPLRILYEDNHIIVVYKSAGVLVQGDKTGEVSLLDIVKRHIKDRDNKPGNVFLGLVHRLDRNVDGIVLFAKTSKGASRLSQQFREHTVRKVYETTVHGVVSGSIGQKKSLVHFLIHDKEDNCAVVLDTEIVGSQKAELEYEIVEVGETDNIPTSRLRIYLKTGRHHQIRAQLSHIGHPILGDAKYGSSINYPDKHIALTATELRFVTATEGKEVIVSLA